MRKITDAAPTEPTDQPTTRPPSPHAVYLGNGAWSSPMADTQTDAQGRQYVTGPDGQPIYTTPSSSGGGYQVPGFSNGGKFHTPSTWDNATGQWKAGGLDWGTIIPLVGMTAATAGLAGPALVGGAAGAGVGAGSGAGAAGAGLGGVEAGAASGLGAAALPGAGTALGAAGAGSGFLAATAPLAATQIGTGMVPAITGGTGMASGSGFLNALKTGYDLYNKGKNVASMFTQSGPGGAPSPASAVGQTAGSIEQQRMNALIAQAKLQQEQDALALSRTNAGVNVGNLNLAQQKQALSAPGSLANQSVRGDILANSQDAAVSGLPSYIHVGQVSGGLRPSMLSAASRSLGGQMSRNALADSTSGKYTTQAPLPTIPTATPLPTANAYDSLLQGVGTGASFLDALKGVGNGSSSPSGALPTGFVPGDVTDAQSQLMPPPQDTSNLPDNGSGIDPALLAWWQQQSDPTAQGGSNG